MAERNTLAEPTQNAKVFFKMIDERGRLTCLLIRGNMLVGFSRGKETSPFRLLKSSI